MIITKKERVTRQTNNQHRKISYDDTLSPSTSMQMLCGLTKYVNDDGCDLTASIHECGEIVIPFTEYWTGRKTVRRCSADDLVMLRDILFTLNGCGHKTKAFKRYEPFESHERTQPDYEEMTSRIQEVRDMLHGRGYQVFVHRWSDSWGQFILHKDQELAGDEDGRD